MKRPADTSTAEDEVVGLASDLIRIDSTNTGDPDTLVGERAAAEYVAEQKATYKTKRDFDPAAMPLDQVVELITDLEKEMKAAAKALDFEHAASLRDEILELKRFVPSHAMGGAEAPERPKRYQKARRAR